MGIYVSPDYLQTIHYYFFALGIVSFTSAVLFWGNGIYTYLFMLFYVAHSGISWYVSWFVHRRVSNVFVLNGTKYAIYHVLLTAWSAGLAMASWQLFPGSFEAIMNSLLTVNFFAVFMVFMWYVIISTGLGKIMLDWQDMMQFRKAMGEVKAFREKNGLKLVDDFTLSGYVHGASAEIDQLFMRAKKAKDSGDVKAFADAVRKIEITLSEAHMADLAERVKTLEARPGRTEAENGMIKTYRELIHGYGSRAERYDRLFKSVFGK